MEMVMHTSESRGHANLGWLDTHNTFSFGNYRNPERSNFGALSVLNDDFIFGGMGFNQLARENIEMVLVPVKGGLVHKDNLGNSQIINEYDIQVMSAGKGIVHSEINRYSDRITNFLQIWIRPEKKNVKPRYEQMTPDPEGRRNRLQQVISPSPDDEGLWINQQAWFYLGDFDAGNKYTYTLKDNQNGVYIFVIDGEIRVEDQKLIRRDGLGLWNTGNILLESENMSRILLMEVPMQ